MDLSKIKNLVKQNGDKFVFIENGEPEIVMMSFEEYQKLLERKLNTRIVPELSEFESIRNSGHSGEKFRSFESRQESSDSRGLLVRSEDIRLEDLPI